MALSDKSKRVVFIITDKRLADAGYSFEFVNDLINKGLPSIDGRVYALIVHDLDTHPKDNIAPDGSVIWRAGEPKTPHIHCWCECGTTRRIGTIISKLAQSLDIDGTLISCEKAVSMEGAVQYLIHKNDPDKHQYYASDIRTNIPQDELKLVLERPSETFSVDFIYNAFKKARGDKREFIKIIGMDRYVKYFRVIDAIEQDIRYNGGR